MSRRLRITTVVSLLAAAVIAAWLALAGGPGLPPELGAPWGQVLK
jgi:hypothetical protein